MSQNFRSLQVWEDSIEFHKQITSTIAKFPKEEIYAMSSQLRRASLSISNNITEGCGRESQRELRNFLNIAIGSTKEVENMIIVAKELSYITETEFKDLEQKIFTIGKKLNSLMQKIAEQVGRSPRTKNQKPKTKNIFRGDRR